MSPLEEAHVDRVKAVPCVLCDAAPPTEAHEIKQGLWWLSISACPTCHRSRLGIHGDQTMLRLRYRIGGAEGELMALNETLRRIAHANRG